MAYNFFGSTALNALLNKIKTALDGKSNTGHKHTKSEITDFPSSLPASDVYSWAKASSKPSYAWSEITDKPSSFTPASHTHSSVIDAGNNSSATTFAYSKAGLGYSNYSWLAGWNGYELRAIDKTQFATASHTHTKSQITDFPSSLPASDVYSWAKASSKPSYAWSEITNKPTEFNPSSHTHSQYLTSHQSLANYVTKRDNGYSYNNLASFYMSGIPAYIRIYIPKKSAVWTMCSLEISLKSDYSNGYFGKILFYGNWSSSAEWHAINASVYGSLPQNIKLYCSDKQYVYIAGCSSYVTCTVDKMTIGDNAISQDMSNVTIDYVSALPTVYQTVKMRYDVNSSNIADQSVASATNSMNAINATDAVYAAKAKNGVLYYNEGKTAWSSLNSSNWVELRSPAGTVYMATYHDFKNQSGSWVNISASDFIKQSSRRYKENIVDITESDARKLLDVNVVRYDYKDGVMSDESRFNRSGVIAEDVVDVIPEAVSYREIDELGKVPDGVDYSSFVPYLIKMVQMQQKEIDDLKTKVEELSKTNL